MCVLTQLDVVTQAYEGRVLSVSCDVFTALLVDMTGDGADLIAEFWRSRVRACDIDLVQVNSEFTWRLGYNEKPRRRYGSELYFHRPRKLTEEELAQAKAEAEELVQWWFV